MKKIRTLLYGLFATAMMAGCSTDDMPVNGGGNTGSETGDGDGYYMTLDIQMPDGKNLSRSHTVEGGGSNSGTEVGSDAENAVTSALIILAKESDKSFIAAGEVSSNNLTPQSISTPSEKKVYYKALTRIEKTFLQQLYEGAVSGQSPRVNVYVFCNPNEDLANFIAGLNYGDQWVDRTCTVIEGIANTANINTSIWSAGSFLMNNEREALRLLPKDIIEWEEFDKIEKPFHLSGENATATAPELPDNSTNGEMNPIKVERSVARFDFRDGSNNDCTYNVLFHSHDGVEQEDEPLVAVQLQRMALVNMSNKFYYLKRVSDDGLSTGANFKLCGAEKPWSYLGGTDEDQRYGDGNYVVGPYADKFLNKGVKSDFTTYFNYPFFNDVEDFSNSTMAGGQWDVYNIADVIKPGNTMDNYENQQRYYVWRYVTENVIPAGPSNQVNGVSTGIVFKGRMLGTSFAEGGGVVNNEQSWEKDINKQIALCLNRKPFVSNGKDHNAIVGNSKEDPILYYFDGSLYMTWNHIRQAAIQLSVSYNNGKISINRSNSLYRAVFGDGPIPTYNVFIESDGTEKAFTDPMWAENANAQNLYEQSADYAWSQWNAAGKPVPEVLGDLANADKTLQNMRAKVTGAGITIYQSSVGESGPGYYCYYYYWNRHNDNGMNGIMGPMEFAVVRNNVYKLSVDKISRLGHPRIPANDPENPDPSTPDESSKVYLDVNVEVTPWAVRINKIEF